MRVARVLLIDDNATDRKLLRDALQHAGYDVDEAGDGAAGLRALFAERPDAVVLDVMMPGMDGWTTCARIRELTDVPIIMLTSLDREDEIVRGFEAGADDFVSKPVSPRHRMARGGALLRRAAPGAGPVAGGILYSDRGLTIDEAAHSVVLRGLPVELSPTEFRLLVALARTPDRVLPYETLLREVWGPEYADEIDYLRVFVSRLRKKLEADPGEPVRIRTERGFGYRFSRAEGLMPAAALELPEREHPPIEYTATTDGVRTALWATGGGPPLVLLPTMPFSHIQREWELPEYRFFYEALARNHTLIHYDGRGSGLSTREIDDISLEAHVRDLDAVVRHAGHERVALLALFRSGPVAMAYAAEHPERVSELVLWSTHARAADRFEEPRMQAFAAAREKDWELYTDMVANALWGWPQPEIARRTADLLRESTTSEMERRMGPLLESVDVTGLLARVSPRALVMNRRGVPAFDVRITQELAAALPDARLELVDGDALVPYMGDVGALVRLIDEFLLV